MSGIGIKFGKINIFTLPMAITIIPLLLLTSLLVAVFAYTFQFVMELLS